MFESRYKDRGATKVQFSSVQCYVFSIFRNGTAWVCRCLIKENILLKKSGVLPQCLGAGVVGRSVAVQSVLYHNNPVALKRTLDALACAVRLAKKSGLCTKLDVFWGDCSSTRCLSREEIAAFVRDYQDDFSLHYTFFNKNLGSAAGHNSLAGQHNHDMMLIQNPDIIMAPDVIELFLRAIARDGVGMVEAKQLPIEHPKEYDQKTGETYWAATACALFCKKLFDKIGGFDAENFFLYGDDVDFSWRVRLEGLKILFLGHAVVFHDKRLSHDGGWLASEAERYYSAEAALFLSWKWSYDRRNEKLLRIFSESDDKNLQKAVKVFEKRKHKGRLPVQIDRYHHVGYIDRKGYYARHRFEVA